MRGAGLLLLVLPDIAGILVYRSIFSAQYVLGHAFDVPIHILYIYIYIFFFFSFFSNLTKVSLMSNYEL